MADALQERTELLRSRLHELKRRNEDWTAVIGQSCRVGTSSSLAGDSDSTTLRYHGAPSASTTASDLRTSDNGVKDDSNSKHLAGSSSVGVEAPLNPSSLELGSASPSDARSRSPSRPRPPVPLISQSSHQHQPQQQQHQQQQPSQHQQGHQLQHNYDYSHQHHHQQQQQQEEQHHRHTRLLHDNRQERTAPPQRSKTAPADSELARGLGEDRFPTMTPQVEPLAEDMKDWDFNQDRNLQTSDLVQKWNSYQPPKQKTSDVVQHSDIPRRVSRDIYKPISFFEDSADSAKINQSDHARSNHQPVPAWLGSKNLMRFPSATIVPQSTYARSSSPDVTGQLKPERTYPPSPQMSLHSTLRELAPGKGKGAGYNHFGIPQPIPGMRPPIVPPSDSPQLRIGSSADDTQKGLGLVFAPPELILAQPRRNLEASQTVFPPNNVGLTPPRLDTPKATFTRPQLVTASPKQSPRWTSPRASSSERAIGGINPSLIGGGMFGRRPRTPPTPGAFAWVP